MSDEGEGGYVHEPEAFEGDAADTAVDGQERASHARGAEREFGRRGWLLVGWIVVAFLLVPAYLFFYPRASDAVELFGLGFRDTYLFVPLLPALVLGALAVWATTRP